MDKLDYNYSAFYLLISSVLYYFLFDCSVAIKLICLFLLFLSFFIGCLYHKLIIKYRALHRSEERRVG